MHDGANEPAAGPGPWNEATGSTLGKQATLVLLGIGAGVGVALGILLTIGVYTTYTFFIPTSSLATGDSVQVFKELNGLRMKLNELNEENKQQEKAKEDAMRQARQAMDALASMASRARAPDSETPGAVPTAKKQDGGMDRSAGEKPVAKPVERPVEKPAEKPVMKPHDPFAEVDEEIKRLEQTQKVLNTILDMFSPTKGKEPAKDR